MNSKYQPINDKKESENRKYDLEGRLTDFSVRIIDIIEALPNTRAGNHIAGQLVRSCTAPAANYAEAQSAESRGDFIHKIKIVLKELRETGTWLKINAKAQMIESVSLLEPLLKETD